MSQQTLPPPEFEIEQGHMYLTKRGIDQVGGGGETYHSDRNKSWTICKMIS